MLVQKLNVCALPFLWFMVGNKDWLIQHVTLLENEYLNSLSSMPSKFYISNYYSTCGLETQSKFRVKSKLLRQLCAQTLTLLSHNMTDM
jgi:hypothetical protein